MYRTGEAESLLPVFGLILAFSPEELKSCREGLKALNEGNVPLPAAAAAVDGAVSGASSMMSSLGSWVSWGGGQATGA